jgi:type I restriction enzyme M protein
VEWGDTIRNPKLLDGESSLRHFDIVVANPPFSLEKWGVENAEGDKFGRFRRGIPPKTKGDYAFVLHMIETLKPKTGRMGVVVPHGVLFRGSSEAAIRQKSRRICSMQWRSYCSAGCRKISPVGEPPCAGRARRWI